MKPKPLCTVLLFLLAPVLPGQELDPRLVDPLLNLAENQHLNAQAEALLTAIDATLQRHIPALPEPGERRLALLTLDAVLHDEYAPSRPPVQAFLGRRIARAVEHIASTRVRSGARIWKLYNHGFVVRTASVTFAFDLVSARNVRADGFRVPDELIERLAEECDALFVSHRHPDHADESVARAFLDRGKPVVAPPEVWQERPIHARLTHLERVAHEEQVLSVQGGAQQLRVVCYPGHQGASIENNVPLVFTPENLSFGHFGDQSNSDDFAWIDGVKTRHEVDVLLPNCWTTDIVRAVAGFDPAVVVTGHENEMGHTIDHREPYWLTYQRRSGSARFGGDPDVGYEIPLVLMTWGESYHYEPR
jgi:L-ascorbate metabolism protein UlaG (beta-lactamase superfamily)